MILTDIRLEDVLGAAGNGIMKWFRYLINFFTPALPIWSNLLLGKHVLSRLLQVYMVTSVFAEEKFNETKVPRSHYRRMNQLPRDDGVNSTALQDISLGDELSLDHRLII